jgi:hypothetical protein
MIPPLPKNYDVENRGHYSAGRLGCPVERSSTHFCIPPSHTIPFRNSSSGYFVPRHVMPSSHSVRIIECSSV